MNTEVGQSSQPLARGSLLNRTLVSWHGLGWLMIPAIFMPLCQGCNGAVEYPSGVLHPSKITPSSVFLIVAVFGVPLVVASILTLAAALKSRLIILMQFWLQIAVLVGLFLAIYTAEAISEIRQGEVKGIVRITMSVLPMVIGVPWWIGAPVRRRQWSHAWGRVQQLTMVGSWILLNLMCLFKPVLLIGYWYTSTIMVATALVAEISKGRLAHDLWDATAPVERFQFSLKDIFVWMSVVPLLGAYYSSIEPIVDWLFPGA